MKMQSKYFFVPSPPFQVWRKCSSTEQPVRCSLPNPESSRVRKIEKKKIRDKERCGKGDSGSLRFPRPGHVPPSDGENSDYCRKRVGHTITICVIFDCMSFFSINQFYFKKNNGSTMKVIISIIFFPQISLIS